MTPQEPKDQPDQTLVSPLAALSGFGTASPLLETASPPTSLASSADPSDPPFLFVEGEDLVAIEEQRGLSAPFVLPFQHSAPLPMGEQTATGDNTRAVPLAAPALAQAAKASPQRRTRPLLSVVLTVGIVLMTVLIGSLLVFAQQTLPPRLVHSTPTTIVPSAVPTRAGTQPPARPTATTASKSSVRPTPTRFLPDPLQGGNPFAAPSLAVLNAWGWTNAGLSLGDAQEAQRTAFAFVDHEMSFDYRDLGTPTQHGGTLTSATFLLTKGGKVRFVSHDKREINNVLYNTILRQKLIQNAFCRQVTLVQFQHVFLQGKQHQFVWVTVAFDLHQSTINPATGKRQDATIGPSRMQQMQVLLMRVPPAEQGASAPLGGIGWLVNTYALGTNTLPPVATSPTL